MSHSTLTLLFLHIPKAAGHTLFQIIDRHYDKDTIFSIRDNAQESIKRLSGQPVEQKQQYRCIRGHMSFGLHEMLPQPSTYITLLRDPIDRTISYYYFVLRNPKHYLYEKVVSEKITLVEMLRQQLTPDLDNGQVRLLSGVWNDVPVGECTLEMLELAKENIERDFAVVGLSKRFDESLFLLKEQFRWRNILYVRKNVTPKRPSRQKLPSETINVIKQYNELDVALHRYVRQRFDAEIRRRGPSFQHRLQLFQLLNRAYAYYKQTRISR